jgi:hypothetical protein
LSIMSIGLIANILIRRDASVSCRVEEVETPGNMEDYISAGRTSTGLQPKPLAPRSA